MKTVYYLNRGTPWGTSSVNAPPYSIPQIREALYQCLPPLDSPARILTDLRGDHIVPKIAGTTATACLPVGKEEPNKQFSSFPHLVDWHNEIKTGNNASCCSRKSLRAVPKGAFQRYIVLLSLLGILIFLMKTASFVFRTIRTFGTVRTQLYLSCSSLVPL